VKFVVRVDGGPEESLEILAPAPRCRFRFDGGAESCADVAVPEPGVYSVLIDGRAYEARIEEAPEALVVIVDGRRFEMAVRDPRRFTRKTAGAGAGGVHTVAAPMPGKVVRLLAQAGDDVEAGQGLLVVEAMKMQNELKAPRAGRVLSMTAAEGATVSAGDALATIG
jgi:biotin carboxyl carrier protein